MALHGLVDDHGDVAYVVEIQGLYDGYSIVVYDDGHWQNRWEDEGGSPIPGLERRWKATNEYIAKNRPNQVKNG